VKPASWTFQYPFALRLENKMQDPGLKLLFFVALCPERRNSNELEMIMLFIMIRQGWG
jgi:hypothetical protein